MRFNKIYFSNPAVKEQKAEAERKANLSEAEREEEERRETEWQNSDEAHECVCNGAKVFCPWCSVKTGTLKVTSTLVRLHSQPWATDADNDGKTNFDFAGGLCLHPSVQKPNMPPPPCIQVISLGEWKNIGTMGVDKYTTLLKKSVIPCMISHSNLKITDSGQEESMANNERPPVSKKCRVEFDVKYKDITKNGYFGFDSYEKTQSGCEENSKRILQREYHVFPAMYKEKKKVEDYYVPWVSIRKGTIINLDVEYNIKGNFTEIKFEGNPDFTFEPTTLTPKTTSVKITCNNIITSNTLVRVIADGKTAGGIYFYENKPKVVNVRYVAVGLKDEEEAYGIRKKYTKTKLEGYFRQAFNPAVIDINIENEEADIFDISYYKQYSKYIKAKREAQNDNKEVPKADFVIDQTKEKFVEELMACFVIRAGNIKKAEEGKKDPMVKLLQLISDAYYQDYNPLSEGKNIITLFLTNFTHQWKINGKIEDTQTTEAIHGFTTIGAKETMMFFGNSRNNPSVEIPHEIMHNLGLPHTFSEPREKPLKDIVFTMTKTNNYMDYLNTRETIWKYQWDEMRKSIYAE